MCSVTVIPSPRTASAWEHTREWVRARRVRDVRSVREVTVRMGAATRDSVTNGPTRARSGATWGPPLRRVQGRRRDRVDQLRQAQQEEVLQEAGQKDYRQTVRPEHKAEVWWGGPQEMREALQDKEQEAL